MYWRQPCGPWAARLPGRNDLVRPSDRRALISRAPWGSGGSRVTPLRQSGIRRCGKGVLHTAAEWSSGSIMEDRPCLVGMTIREQLGVGSVVPFFDRVAAGDDLGPAADTPDLRGYVELLLRSGFPEPALFLAAASRRRWLESYVEHLLTRDADQVDGSRDPARLRRYLEAFALNTAGIVEDRTLFEAAGINRKTALAAGRPAGHRHLLGMWAAVCAPSPPPLGEVRGATSQLLSPVPGKARGAERGGEALARQAPRPLPQASGGAGGLRPRFERGASPEPLVDALIAPRRNRARGRPFQDGPPKC